MIIPDLKGYYRTLGISRSASPALIKSAFRTRAKQTHPDIGGNEAAFRAVTEAYDILGDRRKRAAYDASCRSVAEARQKAHAKSNREVVTPQTGARPAAASPIDLFWLFHGQIYASASLLAAAFIYGAWVGDALTGLGFGLALGTLIWRAYAIAADRIEKAAFELFPETDTRSDQVGWAIIKAVLFAVSIVVYLSVLKSLVRTAPSWVEIFIWFTLPFEWLAVLAVPLPEAYQADYAGSLPDDLLPIARHLFLAPWICLGAYIALQAIRAAPQFIIRRYLAIIGAGGAPMGANLAVGALFIFTTAGLYFLCIGFAAWVDQDPDFLTIATIDGVHDIAVSSFVFASFICAGTLTMFTTILIVTIRASYHIGPPVSDQRIVAAMSSATSMD